MRYNKAVLVGRLVADPSVTEAESGTRVSFRLAVSHNRSDTDYFTCVAYDKAAEIVSNYCSKGTPILVEGMVRTRRVEEGGQMRTIYYIQVTQVALLGGGGDSKRAGEAASDVKKRVEAKRQVEPFPEEEGSEDPFA